MIFIVIRQDRNSFYFMLFLHCNFLPIFILYNQILQTQGIFRVAILDRYLSIMNKLYNTVNYELSNERSMFHFCEFRMTAMLVWESMKNDMHSFLYWFINTPGTKAV